MIQSSFSCVLIWFYREKCYAAAHTFLSVCAFGSLDLSFGAFWTVSALLYGGKEALKRERFHNPHEDKWKTESGGPHVPHRLGLKSEFFSSHQFTRQKTQAPRLQLENTGFSRGAASKPRVRAHICCPWWCWKDTHTKVLTGEGKDEIRSTEYPVKSKIETFPPWVFTVTEVIIHNNLLL